MTSQAINIRHATQEDIVKYGSFDYTKLSAIATCPTWGIIRYDKHLSNTSGKRILPLEAGTVMHEVFALCRVLDCFMYYKKDTVEYKLVDNRLKDLYEETRLNKILDIWHNNEDEFTRVRQAVIYSLESSGYYDDPEDRLRTLDKLIEAAIAYVDRYEWAKSLPYIDPATGFVGIEQPFAMLVECGRPFVYTGKIDGVHVHPKRPGALRVEENKTANRLNDAWEMSFDTSHQVTGYIMASRLFTGLQVDEAMVRGVAIPQPKGYINNISNVPVRRTDKQIENWMKWVQFIINIRDTYADDVLSAPMFTHSCNRYFRPCSFIPLCSADEDDKQSIYEQFEHDEWSPLSEQPS